jgi:hypothetical protein
MKQKKLTPFWLVLIFVIFCTGFSFSMSSFDPWDLAGEVPLTAKTAPSRGWGDGFDFDSTVGSNDFSQGFSGVQFDSLGLRDCINPQLSPHSVTYQDNPIYQVDNCILIGYNTKIKVGGSTYAAFAYLQSNYGNMVIRMLIYGRGGELISDQSSNVDKKFDSFFNVGTAAANSQKLEAYNSLAVQINEPVTHQDFAFRAEYSYNYTLTRTKYGFDTSGRFYAGLTVWNPKYLFAKYEYINSANKKLSMKWLIYDDNLDGNLDNTDKLWLSPTNTFILFERKVDLDQPIAIMVKDKVKYQFSLVKRNGVDVLLLQGIK